METALQTQGFQDLVMKFFETLANIDIRTINSEWATPFLDAFSFIWNPIWQWVTTWLENFGF